jgi:hypothetical protein
MSATIPVVATTRGPSASSSEPHASSATDAIARAEVKIILICIARMIIILM